MLLSVEIEKKLGNFHLQTQFDLQESPLALLGASGCGKSLTLRCIAGILTPDSGKIILNGKTLYDSAAHVNLPPQVRHIGYLFQQYALFPNMTVRQNIEAAIADKHLRNAIVNEKLRQFHLESLADRHPSQLSGGQQQRTALARILASSPEAILLDEPLSALDSYLRYQLELELSEVLDQFSGPVIWVTHDRGEAFRNCRKVCVLENGRSQDITSLDSLVSAPATEAAARLSGCQNFSDATAKGNALFLPQWNLTLHSSAVIPHTVTRVGLRAHHLHPDPSGFPCHVIRVIEDIFSTIVLLQPDNALPDAPPLRMELSKSAWQAVPDHHHLSVSINFSDILLLESKGASL